MKNAKCEFCGNIQDFDLMHCSQCLEEMPLLDNNNDAANEEVISTYNLIKTTVPNYDLATKVFLDFNAFNLRNNENGLSTYLGFIPKSLLPYPKNYIKCAYYIFLEKLKKENNVEMFKMVQEIGVSLFYEYPDYEKYKRNLKKKKWYDDNLRDLNQRDIFKKLYGVYEVSEEDYNSSPSAIDCTDEKLIHDFGVLPEIEEDIDMSDEFEKNSKLKNTK